jgi:sigma-54 dependent transcriptional regulator, acetoin dehydrogenase operon transcriptional activator AcoR
VAAGVETEAARRSFLLAGRRGVPDGVVPAAVVASWERSAARDVDPERLRARFVGHPAETAPVVAAAQTVFAEFLAAGATGCSLALVDATGVVRVRQDGDPALGRLLDGLSLVPGHGVGEGEVGTTAASVALHERTGATVDGAQHYHAQLTCLNEAAAPVLDPAEHRVAGVVVVLTHAADATSLRLPLARMLADRVADGLTGASRRRAVHDAFRRADGGVDCHGDWVLATDGEAVLTNAAARHLDGHDARVLGDLVLAAWALQDFSGKHAHLPSGGCAEVTVAPVRLAGELVGCVLTGGPAGAQRSEAVAEAVRRQGSHIAPTTRRDYAEDLRRHDRAHREHAEARIRANRELLSPFLRAQEEVVASITQGRNHLLIGEPGVGKRTLLLSRFRQAHPRGRVVTVDCATAGNGAADPAAALLEGRDGRPQLLVLHGLNALSPVGARRLDEALRPLVALPAPPLVVGCVDTPAVDATRPYGLLLRHFHEITRVPALRYRADEIGEIALSILRRIAAGRSLRLSLQVVRVLEGYAWPGNVSELEDVLRYVVARKPLGEVQPPDLPALCFQVRARRMSMLEAAQCDAIIQALYESRGNRYKAAAMLGIARSSLYRKIDAFGISYIA